MVKRASFLDPRPEIDPDADRRGLQAFRADGIASQVREVILAGPILVGYLLLLGASHATLGLIAAIAPLSQVLQFPTVARLSRTRRRKAIVWHAAVISRVAWIAVVLSPFVVSPGARVPVLLAGIAIATAFGTISGAAWTPWIRDLLGPARLGSEFATRLTVATAVALPVAFAAGVFIDQYADAGAESLPAYTAVLAVGVVASLLGLMAVARIPEPLMAAQPAPDWRALLRASLGNAGERQVIIFLASWTFAVNLAAPFYTVYLLERVGLPMLWVIVLAAVSQGMTAFAVRSWGRIAEQFTMRTVLRVSGILFLLMVAAWPVLGRIEDATLRLVLFGVAHAVAGLATGGVTLGTTTLALEVAPREQAAGFLAANATLSGLAAGIAPLLGGVLSTALRTSQVELELRWLHDTQRGAVQPIALSGLDFLFVASVLLGLYAIHRLLALPEGARGTSRRAMAALAQELQLRARTPVRMLTTVPGLRGVIELPHRLGGRFPRADGGGAESRPGR